jgi:multiple sugar transport system permease protein
MAAWLDARIGWVMVAPAMLVLIGLVAYPLLFNLYVSVHRVGLLNIRGAVWPFVGTLNFERILADPFSHAALLRTAVFAAASVALQLILGLAGALAFNVQFRGKAALMVLALVPMMITPVVVGIAWRMLLNYDWGFANYLMTRIGLAAQPWLAEPTLAMISIIAVQVWWGVSFVMLILLGGLTALPREPFEAAAIDGASDFAVFRYVTLPLLRPVLIVVATIRIIDALREFDVIYTLTGGGPGGATRVFALELFYTAYERGDFGLSSAQALLLVLLIMIFAVGLVRRLARPSDAR